MRSLFHKITVKKRMAPFIPLVLADTQQQGHMFMNIIINAAHICVLVLLNVLDAAWLRLRFQ